MKKGISVLTLAALTVLMAGCRQENTMNRAEITHTGIRIGHNLRFYQQGIHNQQHCYIKC